VLPEASSTIPRAHRTRLFIPVAEVLRQRRIPFLFASGYASKGLLERWRDAVRIQKPFRSEDLAAAIARATA
jgi:hypothetical protein